MAARRCRPVRDRRARLLGRPDLGSGRGGQLMAVARLAPIGLSTFGRSEVAPELPASVYPARVERLRQAAAERRYDLLVVYADREHSANLAYLTGFDPRF